MQTRTSQGIMNYTLNTNGFLTSPLTPTGVSLRSSQRVNGDVMLKNEENGFEDDSSKKLICGGKIV